MTMRHFAYHRLTDLFCGIINGDEDNSGAINVEYNPGDVPGTLKDCSFNGFSLTDRVGGGPDSLDGVDFAVWEMARTIQPDGSSFVRSRFVFDASLFGGGAFVITLNLDDDELDCYAYRCPVCGQDDTGFQTFPPTEFHMDKSGAMTVPAGMAVDPSFDDDVPCNCKKCGFQGHKDAFKTGNWEEYTGGVF